MKLISDLFYDRSNNKTVKIIKLHLLIVLLPHECTYYFHSISVKIGSICFLVDKTSLIRSAVKSTRT